MTGFSVPLASVDRVYPQASTFEELARDQNLAVRRKSVRMDVLLIEWPVIIKILEIAAY